MPGRLMRVRSSKYDGSPHWEFDTWHVRDEGTLLVTEDYAGLTLQSPKGPWVNPRDTTNYFWSDRWYNVMRREVPDGGGLYGWYCNITTPAEVNGDLVTYADLDLDVIVEPDLTASVVDEDEFAENSEMMAYPADVVERARAAVDELLALVRGGRPPFDVQ